MKDNNIETKNILNEFNSILIELNIKNEYVNIFYNENNDNNTPINNNNSKYNFNNKNNPFKNGQKRELHKLSEIRNFNFNLNNFRYNSSTSFEKGFNQNQNDKDILILEKINNLIQNNEIFKEIINREDFKTIKELINNNNLNNTQKQLEIENFYINLFKNKINDILSKPNFVQTHIGHKILKKSIEELNENLDFFKRKGNMKNKNFSFIFFNIENSLIITILFSIPVPFLFNYENTRPNSYHKLKFKIGKSIYNDGYLKNNYYEYKKFFYNK